MAVLNQVLAIPGSITLSNSSQVDICIHIGSHQFEEISVTSTTSFVARSKQRTDSVSVASD